MKALKLKQRISLEQERLLEKQGHQENAKASSSVTATATNTTTNSNTSTSANSGVGVSTGTSGSVSVSAAGGQKCNTCGGHFPDAAAYRSHFR